MRLRGELGASYMIVLTAILELLIGGHWLPAHDLWRLPRGGGGAEEGTKTRSS